MRLTRADEIRAYRRAGNNVTAAAGSLGMPFTTLYRHLEAAGIDVRRPTGIVRRASRATVSELCDLYAEGLTQRDIAALAGVSQRTARNMLVREGVPIRRPHNPGVDRMAQRRAVLERIGRLDLLARDTETQT